MNNIRIENKIKVELNTVKSKVRSLLLFGSSNKVRFGKNVRLSGEITFGNKVSIQDYSCISGENIKIEDNVFIHENVLIRSNEYITIGENTTINRNCCILAKVKIGK